MGLIPRSVRCERYRKGRGGGEESVSKSNKHSHACSNRDGLAIFLLANHLTDAANLTLPTLDMKTLETIGVLVSYTGVLAGTVLVLDKCDISVNV